MIFKDKSSKDLLLVPAIRRFAYWFDRDRFPISIMKDGSRISDRHNFTVTQNLPNTMHIFAFGRTFMDYLLQRKLFPRANRSQGLCPRFFPPSTHLYATYLHVHYAVNDKYDFTNFFISVRPPPQIIVILVVF